MTGLWRESEWFLEKMNGPLEKHIRGMMVCDKAYLNVVSTSSVLFCDVNPPWMINTLLLFWVGLMTTEFLLEHLSLIK